ncbi:hypothetical protein F442_11897 [Phytophthora nicotianae P10297]|uniref:Chromo domain-containing protein n=2 Tax=Phytophthora nicotianae TaxID=4792 RepID=W2Z0P0_PHYNI|nr:hypothetical protein F442_11897 [Phytophthora nicotianae P10297]
MKTTPAGTTVMQFRPYVSSSTLDDFDEKASLTARRRWWERFLNLTIQGGWSDEMKVYELKLKIQPVVRNWRGQLAPKDRRDLKRLSRLFLCEYVKSRMSEPERYYTMSQYKDETLAFLFRLHLAAERVDLNFRTTKRTREYQIKWKGYWDPEWIPVSQLNCGALLYEFDQGAKAKARFRAMQAGDDHPRL